MEQCGHPFRGAGRPSLGGVKFWDEDISSYRRQGREYRNREPPSQTGLLRKYYAIGSYEGLSSATGLAYATTAEPSFARPTCTYTHPVTSPEEPPCRATTIPTVSDSDPRRSVYRVFLDFKVVRINAYLISRQGEVLSESQTKHDLHADWVKMHPRRGWGSFDNQHPSGWAAGSVKSLGSYQSYATHDLHATGLLTGGLPRIFQTLLCDFRRNTNQVLLV